MRLLGPVEVDSADGQPGPRDRVVLDALAVRHGSPISAEGLAEALWPDGRPASWAKVVQGCISRLRAVLGPEAIETTDRGYRLVPGRLDLDRDEFEDLVRQGHDHLRTGAPERAVVAFERALALWRGDPMVDLVDWMPGRLEATRLEELRRDAEEDLLRARLDAGQHHDVVPEAVVLAGEQPWRERRWELLALAQYRCGRQRDALASIRTARRALGNELGLDPGSGLAELEQAILAQDPSLAADHDAGVATGSCPWMGLVPYDDEHRDTFFGRREDVEECLRRLDDSPLLALVGPSGCGKSSLMRAGIVPALRARGYDVVVLTPGIDPLASLAAARAEAGDHPVLCIDQFEEAFTGSPDAVVAEWLAAVADCARTRPVVLTLRSDHVAGLVGDPGFAALAERGMHLVVPLTGDRLRATIEGPAQVAGLRLEPGLVDLLMREAADEPGALPLLSHALAETWKRREGALLTVEGYQATGGISGAVAASADRLSTSLSDEGRTQLRWLMLRMAGLADQGEPVRMPVDRSLATDGVERARVVDLLVRARLVTSAEGSIELAHESLVRAWPRLRGWLEEDRKGQRVWRHLAASSAEWDRLGRPDSELYTGVRLAAAREWAARPDAQPAPLEQEFLSRSVDHAEAEQRALEQQARHERTQNRRLRGLLVGLGVLLAFALGAAFLAVDRGRSAAAERDAAQESRTLVQHEALVSRSLTLRATNRAAAALLAVEAWRARGDPLAESALLGTFTSAPGFLGTRSMPYPTVQGATIPGTRNAIVSSGNRLHVVDLDTGELGPVFDHSLGDNANMQVLRVSGDGRRVAQLVFDPANTDVCGSYERLERDDGRGCTLLTVFDIESRRPVFGPVPTPFQGGDLAIDQRGTHVAVTGGFDGDLTTYDVDRGVRLGLLAGLPRPEEVYTYRDTGAVAFDRSGRLYLGSMAGPVRVVDPGSLEVRRTYPAPPMSTHNFLAVTPRGLVGAGDQFLVAVDLDDGRQQWRVDLRDDTEASECPTTAVAPAMDRLYCGNYAGEIEERDLHSGQLTGVRRDPQGGRVGDLAVAHGNELVAFGEGNGMSRWRLDGTGPVATMVVPGATTLGGYDETGRLADVIPVGTYGRPYRLVDLSTGEEASRFDLDTWWSSWVGDDTIAFSTQEGTLLGRVGSDTPVRPESRAVRDADWLYPDHDPTTAWAVSTRGRGNLLVQFEVRTGATTGRVVRVPGGSPWFVANTDAGEKLVVSYSTPVTPLSMDQGQRFRVQLVDVDEGPVGRDTPGFVASVPETDGGMGPVVLADVMGGLQEVDPDTLQASAVLPGSVGQIEYLEFSDDGSRLLAAGGNRVAQLFDSDTWTRIGAIPADSPGSVREGFLRSDGDALLANGRLGVVEWDLDPEVMADAACELAGRNLTQAEWTTYLGDEPYRQTCGEFPAGA